MQALLCENLNLAPSPIQVEIFTFSRRNHLCPEAIWVKKNRLIWESPKMLMVRNKALPLGEANDTLPLTTPPLH